MAQENIVQDTPATVEEAELVDQFAAFAKSYYVYEALTAERPYKRAMSPCRAFGIMFSMKGRFDSGILRRFAYVNGIYPAGSLVQLSNGMQTRVHAQSGDIRAPIVEVGFNEDGAAADKEDKLLLDLSRQDQQNPVTIQELVAEDLLETASA